MPRIVRGGLIQATLCEPATSPVEKIKQAMIEKHEAADRQGGRPRRPDRLLAGTVLRPLLLCRAADQVVRADRARARRADDRSASARSPRSTASCWCCRCTRRRTPASTTTRPPSSTPTAPTSASFARCTFRRCSPAFGRSITSGPAISAIRSSKTRFAQVGVYICYDRHFPEGARCLGLDGAEIVFNPSATVAGLSEYLWKLEQPAHAVGQRLFRRRDQSPRLGRAVADRRVLRPELLLRPARQDPGRRSREHRRHRRRRSRPRPDSRGAQHLAVLSAIAGRRRTGRLRLCRSGFQPDVRRSRLAAL